MRTEIIKVSNPHFQWKEVKENGKVVGFEKEILSANTIEKDVLVTYDDSGKEINREAYVEKENEVVSFLKKASDSEIEQIKQLLKL